jgi:hypothetical protein
MSKRVKTVKDKGCQFVSASAGMPNQTKGNTLRLYLRDEDLQALGQLTEALEISQTEVMSRIMAAGIRSLMENGKRMPLPLKFRIAEGLDAKPRR